MVWVKIWLALYSFLGLFFGYFLSKISPEEMKPGSKYFNYGKVLVLCLIILFGLIMGINNLGFFVFLSAIIGVILGLYINNVFFIFALGLGFSTGDLSVIFATLIFVYGMFEGSLRYKDGFLKKEVLWFVIPLILIILLDFSKYVDTSHIISLVLGYSLAYAYKLYFKR